MRFEISVKTVAFDLSIRLLYFSLREGSDLCGRQGEEWGEKTCQFFLICTILSFLIARARLRGKKDGRSHCRVDSLKSQSGTFSKGNTNVYKHINFVFLPPNE